MRRRTATPFVLWTVLLSLLAACAGGAPREPQPADGGLTRLEEPSDGRDVAESVHTPSARATAPGTSAGAPDAKAEAAPGQSARSADAPRETDHLHPPTSQGSTLPAYHASMFYESSWPPEIAANLPWQRTASLPQRFFAVAQQAAARWNSSGTNVGFVASDVAASDFPPALCGPQQLSTNGLHFGDVDGRGDMVAVTHTCSRGGEALSFQVVLDRDDDWHVTNRPVGTARYDLYGVLMHEFGHATHWSGHYSEDDPRCAGKVPQLLMCPELPQGSTAWRTLSPLDASIVGQQY